MTHAYAPLPSAVEVMSHPVASIDPDLRINVALEVMRSNNVRRLPVLSKTGRLIGIITLSQVRVAQAGHDDLNADMPFVRDVMTDYVYTIGPDTSLAEAAKMMAGHDISSLPVVQDGKVVGMLTESDIFKFLASWIND